MNRPSETNKEQEAQHLTVDEAAQLLGVSTRTVHRYAKRGLLGRIQSAISTYYVRADVLKLAPQLKNGRLQRTSSLRMSVIQERLEETMSAMDAITVGLDAQRSTLMLSDEEALSLFLSAKSFAESGWPPGSEGELIRVILGLKLENVRQFELVAEQGEGWKPFLALAEQLEKAVVDRPLALLCYAARAHIQAVARECIEEREGCRAWHRELRQRAEVDRNQLRRAARTNQNISQAKAHASRSDTQQQLVDALAAFEKKRSQLDDAKGFSPVTK